MNENEPRVAAIVRRPGPEYAEKHRFWQGCPTILRTPGGILYAGWYTGGTREPSPRNCNILVRSRDGGGSWSDVLLVVESVPDRQLRAIDIQLWLDPRQRMWLFWTQRDDRFANADPRHLSVWAIICAEPDAETPEWSEPRYVAPGFLRCQPTVLADGRIWLFSYDWSSEYYTYSESRDGGQSWERRRGGRKVPTPFDEGMAVERRDGSIRMLARCDGGALAESVSPDGGKSWSDGVLTNLRAPSSRFFFKRLRSGRILLVRNDSLPPHRRNLTAFLSEDDGESWPWKLLIDPDDGVSYPDAAEGDGGELFLVHDHGRCSDKEILFSRFTEADIVAGKLLSPDSFLKRIVSKAPARPLAPAEYDRQRREDEHWLQAHREMNEALSV